MYVSCNTKALSCNHCCGGKGISITQPEYVFVALGMQHAMHMCLIVICGLPNSETFCPHYLINGTVFERKFLGMKCVNVYQEQTKCT